MASNYKTAVAPRNAALDAIGARLNNGKIEIRTGSQPSNITDASTGTLLASPTYGATAFGSAANGVITANAIASDTNAAASGDAGYFREYASGAADTAAESEGTAGETGDSPDLVFDNKTITATGTVAISSMTKTLPEQ